jgi:hypothetical protein
LSGRFLYHHLDRMVLVIRVIKWTKSAFQNRVMVW